VERSLEQPVFDPTYLEFFGLTQSPFARRVDPCQLFQSEQYSLLMEHLANAATNTDSLVVICGADGSGKSTLLNRFVTTIGDNISCVVIDETCHGEEQFYSAFLTQIGFAEITGTASELRNITKEFLVCRGIASDHVLIIIDNAHLTDPMILEQLRWLCEIKIKDRRVLSVVLGGNADIVRVVNAPAMRQTKFRSHVVFGIRNYSEEETANYVWHHLRLAGGNDGVKLPNEASSLIHRYSGGVPHLINRLCNGMLAEAYGLKSRVITEKIVRTAADKQALLPHVIPLHGKGRRRTDPDFKHARVEAETASVDPENLLQQLARLSEQLDDLRADKTRALQDIDARNNDIIVLRDELDSQTTEVEKLAHSLGIDADEITQQNLALSDSAIALQNSEDRSKKLAADLEKEIRAREAAQNELSEATATVEVLSELNQELQVTVDDVQADLTAGLKAADERATEFDADEKNTAHLKVEIEGKVGELDSLRDELASRNEALADLEMRLEESQAKFDSAQLRIAALKNPEELEEIEKVSDKLATDLRKETLARKAAQNELAKATATVEDLSQLKQELQATVDDVQADLTAGLKVADERAVEIDAFEKNAADLKDEIEGKTGELALRNEILADLEVRLDQSQSACELAQLRLVALKSPKELEEVEKASDKLAADLEKETRARKAAQNDLAKATATVEELSELKQELQATVDDVQADLTAGLKVADDRTVKIEALEKHTVDLKEEIEGKTGELDSLRDELASQRNRLVSRNQDVVDLESWLEESQKERASAQLRITALKNPQKLEEIEKASAKVAADLEKETRAREAAENELAKAAATVEERSQLERELQAAVRDLNADLRVAGERAIEVCVLERDVTDLKDNVEKTTRELDSQNQTLADLEKQLEASQNECEMLRRRAPAVNIDEDIGSEEAVTAPARDARVYSSHVVAKFEQSLSNVPAYQTLREYDPAFYDGLIITYKKLVGQDLTDKQVNDALRAEQAELMERLLPRAADDAIIAYARLIVDQLDELQLDGTEPCLTLLIPQSSPDNDISPIYSERSKGRELDTLDITLRTHDVDRQIPAEKDVWPDLGPIFAELFEAFGADNVAAMENSYDPSVDRVLVCNVSRALYSGILNLPKRKAANALRWLLST